MFYLLLVEVKLKHISDKIDFIKTDMVKGHPLLSGNTKTIWKLPLGPTTRSFMDLNHAGI